MQSFLSQALHQFRAPIIAVTDHPTGNAGQHFLGDMQFMSVSRGDLHVDNHAWPTDSHVGTDTEKRLACHLIVAIGRYLNQGMAAGSASEATERHRHAIDDGESRVEGDLAQQVLFQAFLNKPKIGRLACISCAVYLAQLWKVVVIAASEVKKHIFIFTHTQERAHPAQNEFCS